MYVETLRKVGPAKGFGFVDVKPLECPQEARRVAGYLSKYLAKWQPDGSVVVSETVTAAGRTLLNYVNRDLTTLTGCTMRALRNARLVWVARRGRRALAIERTAKARAAFDFFGPSPEREFAIERGMPEDEYGAIMYIATVDDPANPPCPGPVVVHVDGTIECEGGCEGVRHAYHGPGSTYACDAAGGSTSWRCSRCSSDS